MTNYEARYQKHSEEDKISNLSEDSRSVKGQLDVWQSTFKHRLELSAKALSKLSDKITGKISQGDLASSIAKGIIISNDSLYYISKQKILHKDDYAVYSLSHLISYRKIKRQVKIVLKWIKQNESSLSENQKKRLIYSKNRINNNIKRVKFLKNDMDHYLETETISYGEVATYTNEALSSFKSFIENSQEFMEEIKKVYTSIYNDNIDEKIDSYREKLEQNQKIEASNKQKHWLTHLENEAPFRSVSQDTLKKNITKAIERSQKHINFMKEANVHNNPDQYRPQLKKYYREVKALIKIALAWIGQNKKDILEKDELAIRECIAETKKILENIRLIKENREIKNSSLLDIPNISSARKDFPKLVKEFLLSSQNFMQYMKKLYNLHYDPDQFDQD